MHGEIPPQLIEAARNRELSILVGAGVSKAEKAYVPLYTDLADRLYKGDWRRWQDEGKGSVSAFFDEVAKKDRGLHRKLAKIVREAAEDPSFLHQDIVDLMNETGGDTIITTNWDKLLEKAAVGWDVWEKRRRGYEAGRKARGIIHLHGTVDRPGEMLANREGAERALQGSQAEGVHPRVVRAKNGAVRRVQPPGRDEKWTPIIGQCDKCTLPPLVRLRHAALGHEPLPAYTSSGVLRPRP